MDMVKCPKCNKEIDHLLCFSHELRGAKFWVKGNLIEYTDSKLLFPLKPPEFSCPECGIVLFKELAEAREFLLEG